jgi:hypothetical protein
MSCRRIAAWGHCSTYSNLGTKRRRVGSFKSRPLYPRRKNVSRYFKTRMTEHDASEPLQPAICVSQFVNHQLQPKRNIILIFISR